ncbi:MAG TPA: YfiR family protein [Candidatus Binatia bacterium]|nr:YfiR family protein [Candidatus Binatia bacterium]
MRRAKAVAAIALAVLFGFGAASQAQTADELVKAQFVYRFASFVNWPSGAFVSDQAPLRVCVVGADHFATVLSRAVEGQRVGGRGFEVRRVRAAQARQCHIVYASGAPTADALRAVRGAPVLTVTDATTSGDERGVIHFVVVDNRVRFHVDDALAAEGAITIDARLLSLALSVRRRGSA